MPWSHISYRRLDGTYRLDGVPCAGRYLEVELGLGLVQVVPGQLADASQPVFQSARMHRKAARAAFIVATRGQIDAEGSSQLCLPPFVVLKKWS